MFAYANKELTWCSWMLAVEMCVCVYVYTKAQVQRVYAIIRYDCATLLFFLIFDVLRDLRILARHSRRLTLYYLLRSYTDSRIDVACCKLNPLLISTSIIRTRMEFVIIRACFFLTQSVARENFITQHHMLTLYIEFSV